MPAYILALNKTVGELSAASTAQGDLLRVQGDLLRAQAREIEGLKEQLRMLAELAKARVPCAA